ncbi:F-box domain [Arabidopsis suecica]|uniref:F-box domain n=1 Tax=Arabidopsis suecica TaxID=45249 RepID=A0A8T2B9V3_ARASU|nr:F-box domain [Arabidopsis suecica]
MTIINLPEDLLVEILSRVPAVSLARLRSTSRKWNTLIKYERVLAKKHSANALMHSSSLALVLIDYRLYVARFNLHGIHSNVAPSVKVTGQSSLNDTLSNNSSEEVGIRNVIHCDGLLLCSTNDNRLVVWNPCLGETRWIQPRKSYKASDFYALGYDNISSCYKILRMERFGCGIIFQTDIEIYDFTSNSWRVVVVGKSRDWVIIYGETYDMSVNGHIVIWGHTHGMSVNGVTYWLASVQILEDEDHYQPFLLSFDFSTERFGSVSLPGDVYTIPSALSVARKGQQLCMLLNGFFKSYVYYIWIASKSESTGAMSWSKFLTVWDDDIDNHYKFRQFGNGVSFLADYEKEVLLSCNKPNQYSKNIINIMGKGKYTELDHHGAKPTHVHESPTPFLFSYVPSLVQIQQGI